MAIAEFPNDETVAQVTLAGASEGYVRGETLLAFTEGESRKIVRSLPQAA